MEKLYKKRIKLDNFTKRIDKIGGIGQNELFGSAAIHRRQLSRKWHKIIFHASYQYQIS